MGDERAHISISAAVHARLKAYCDAQGITMAKLVESLVTPQALEQLAKRLRRRS